MIAATALRGLVAPALDLATTPFALEWPLAIPFVAVLCTFYSAGLYERDAYMSRPLHGWRIAGLRPRTRRLLGRNLPPRLRLVQRHEADPRPHVLHLHAPRPRAAAWASPQALRRVDQARPPCRAHRRRLPRVPPDLRAHVGAERVRPCPRSRRAEGDLELDRRRDARARQRELRQPARQFRFHRQQHPHAA